MVWFRVSGFGLRASGLGLGKHLPDLLLRAASWHNIEGAVRRASGMLRIVLAEAFAHGFPPKVLYTLYPNPTVLAQSRYHLQTFDHNLGNICILGALGQALNLASHGGFGVRIYKEPNEPNIA